jgi:hypothetical protein
MSNREIVLELVNQLPPDTSLSEIARRLESIAVHRAVPTQLEPVGDAPAGKSVYQKWRGRGRLPVGRNTDEYLRLTRDGDSR